MIRFLIRNGKNTLRFDVPTNEIFEHLQSIRINKDIPVCCSEEIHLDCYLADNALAESVCKRLSHPTRSVV